MAADDLDEPAGSGEPPSSAAPGSEQAGLGEAGGSEPGLHRPGGPGGPGGPDGHGPLGDVELTDVPRVAGGLGAIVATTRHLRAAPGLARGTRALLAMNQQDGFDCPGCAWPEPTTRDRFEFCENGAKAIAEEATTRRARPRSCSPTLSIDELRALSDFELGQLGRLTHPMVLEAAATTGRSRGTTRSRSSPKSSAAPGPTAASFYTSGRTSNEAAFLYQLVGRMFGTNNFPDCSNMCHESSGVALAEVIGVGKGTVSLEDFELAT